MRQFLIALLFSCVSVNAVIAAVPSSSDGTARTLVHLLDYLARDYGGAVQNGKVISETEYKEQCEFVQKVGALQAQVKYLAVAQAQDVSAITHRIAQLQKMIHDKGDATSVANLSHEIRADVIRLSGMETTPAQAPDLAHGAQLYSQRCAACHGAQGFGDGPGAAGIQPKPINFHDPRIVATLSPLQIFNAIRLGVDGTAMAPQSDLSDQDTWNLAYFALSFSKGGSDDSNGGTGGSGSAPLEIARRKLKEAGAKYNAGQMAAAQDEALAAYLEGFEPLEPKLKASDPAFVSQIENLMMRVREAMNGRKSAAEVNSAIESALEGLGNVEAKIQRSEMSPYMSFTAAAAILLREGFEAVLVILAFLGVVRTSGSRRAENWLHAGWIVALACGVAAWVFSGWLIGISGAQREAMEAITAFFAAGVLLFVGFWLHQKTEIGRWKTFVEGRVKAALEQKSLFGLALISFIAVFRETLETVLFLRAIWVDCGSAARTALMAGVACSFVLTMTLAWAAMRFSRRVPIRQLFTASSSLMAGLAVILIGKGIHSLQETGTLSITAAPFSMHSELFGIFPTWETWISQFAILAVIAVLWSLGRRPASSPVPRYQ